VNAQARDRVRAAAAAFVDALVAALADDEEGTRPDQLYTVDEACRELRVGRSLLYSLIAAGQLHVIKAGRRTLVPSSAIAAYITDQEEGR
jgi:excisionase family DNA binding protein